MADKTLDEVLATIESDMSDTRRKANEIQKHRIDAQHENLIKNKELEKLTSNIDLSIGNSDYINKIRNNNSQYFISLKDSKVFINNDFKKAVPYHPRSVVLVAANTGEGKSTTVANLAYHALLQNQRVLVIQNEEKANDTFNRVTCLIKEWNYQNHHDFTENHKETFDKYINILGRRMTVIDNDHQGQPGQTATIEGVRAIFDTLLEKLKDGIKYDVILIDYYQNISFSSKNPTMETWQVQEMFTKLLDSFKNTYPAPIVIMAQKKPTKEDDKIGFKDSIEGRKSILNVVTCAIEMRANRDKYRTEWNIKKSRFSSANGKTLYTGYRNGKYVYYSTDFQKEALRIHEEKSMGIALGGKV